MVVIKNVKMLNMPGQENQWHVPNESNKQYHCKQAGYSEQEKMDTDKNPNKDSDESNKNPFDFGLDLSPYIREELKITIQRKRAERGLEEIKVEPNEIVHYDLSEDELQKKQQRKERNKIAAAKLRKKNKLAELSMREEFAKQTELNKRLKHDLDRIEQERASILESLNESQSKLLMETINHRKRSELCNDNNVDEITMNE